MVDLSSVTQVFDLRDFALLILSTGFNSSPSYFIPAFFILKLNFRVKPGAEKELSAKGFFSEG